MIGESPDTDEDIKSIVAIRDGNEAALISLMERYREPRRLGTHVLGKSATLDIRRAVAHQAGVAVSLRPSSTAAGSLAKGFSSSGA